MIYDEALDETWYNHIRKVRYWPVDQPVGHRVALCIRVHPFTNNLILKADPLTKPVRDLSVKAQDLPHKAGQ